MSSNYCAITDRTSTSILLNSSRHDQAPDWMRPEKSLAIILYSTCSLQLKTTQKIPRAFAKSLVDSVLPVPAGP